MKHASTCLSRAMSLEDAEGMRVVRNSCREFMTNSTAEISKDEQERWFVSLDRSVVRPYIFKIDFEDKSLPRPYCVVGGYGLIRLVDGRWWLSGGLLPELRGNGFGRILFSALADVVKFTEHKMAWLTVRQDNTKAIRCYESIGFQQVDAEFDGLAPTFVMRRLP